MREFTEPEFALLHRALFEFRGRPMTTPEELRALQSADQKMLKARGVREWIFTGGDACG